MTPRNLLVAIVAVAIVAAALTFLLYEPSTAIAAPETSRPDAEATQPVAVGADAATAPSTTSTPVVAEAPQRTAAEPVAAAAPGPLARVVGRCVDADGAPLAGCKLHLHGWGADSKRMDAWSIEHGEAPPWQKLEDVVTGDDGRFAFAFWPPPPFHYSLDVSKDGCGSLAAHWRKLDEGTTKDLGDITMTAGVKVRGRVVDKQANAVPQTYLMISRVERRNDEAVGPAWGAQVRTADDGTFATRGWLVPGTYELGVNGRELASEQTIELIAGSAEEELTVVLADEPEKAKIMGRVVDETGAPAAKVELMVIDADCWADTRSEADGTFVLTTTAKVGDAPTTLQVKSSTYQALEERQQVTWGSSDVEVRVKRLGTLTIRVTDEALQPVSRYLVRMVQLDATVRSSRDLRARTQGEHEDGTATLPGLRRGKWLLMVEFAAQSGLEKITWQREVGEVPPDRLDLVAHPSASRELLVLDTGGNPVAGATVRLCDMFGKTFEQQYGVMNSEQWQWNAANLHAEVLLEGKTDDDGRFPLRGPGDRELGLLIGGDGGCLATHQMIQLRAEGELVVRVDRGASLTGHCEPAEGLAALRRLAGLGDGQSFGDQAIPRLQLRRDDREMFPVALLNFVDKSTLRLADDGTFAASGIPAGAWQVWLQAFAGSGNGGGSRREVRLADVTLVAGQATELTLDLTPVIPGTLTVRVLHNGAPVTEGSLGFSDGHNGGSMMIGADGRCSDSLLPGSYQLNLQPPYLVYPSQVDVRSGEETVVELQFFSGKLTLQLLDPDGAPAEGTGVFVEGATWPIGTTDQKGHVELVRAPGTLRLSVLPERYATQEAQRQLWTEAQARGAQDPFGPLRIPIGEVVLQANGEQQVELRLPEAWRQ